MYQEARGIYRHYKGKLYQLIDIAKHSETQEELVVYESLYDNSNGKIWVRPKKMFFEEVEVDGKKQPRFSLLNALHSNKKVVGNTLHGKTKEIEVNKLAFRPAVYGIIEHNESLLLVNTRSTGKWFFPGGEIEKGEKIEESLKREIKEEAGIEVEVKELFKVHESFFYYDPWDKAFQNISFIYRCRPLSFELSDAKNEARDEAEKPQWVPIKNLKENQFQDWGASVFKEYASNV